jgi:hypothetical protein
LKLRNSQLFRVIVILISSWTVMSTLSISSKAPKLTTYIVFSRMAVSSFCIPSVEKGLPLRSSS